MHIKNTLVIAIIVLSINIGAASTFTDEKIQSQPEVEWFRVFGDSLENYYGKSIELTFDGGYVIAGYHDVFLCDRDMYVLRIDSNGTILWNRTFGGAKDDYGYSVQQTGDGGFVIAGYTHSFGEDDTDVYLVKTDSVGNSVWNKTLGGANFDYGFSVQQTFDGGFVIAGSTYYLGVEETNLYDAYLVKTDSAGYMLWNKTLGGQYYDSGSSVIQASDGGYVMVGSSRTSESYASSEVYLIKTDSSGNILWNKTFGGEDYDCGSDVRKTIDGGYIIVGSTRSLPLDWSNIYIVKTDSNGNELWNKTIGESKHSERGMSIDLTNDGGYIITGEIEVEEDVDLFLVKVDSNGKVLWTKTFGYRKDWTYAEVGESVRQTNDGGYVIAGTLYHNSLDKEINTKLLQIKIKPNGFYNVRVRARASFLCRGQRVWVRY